jgi:hypothetical protein
LALESNLRTTAQFLSNIGTPQSNQAGLLWKDIEPDYIISLLQGFETHDEDNSFNEVNIIEHINRRVTAGELTSWSIGLINNSNGRVLKPFSQHGIDYEFGLSTRSRLKGRDSIGELVQPIHFAMDLPGDLDKYRDGVSFSYTKMYNSRSADNPLMLIYTIDKDSEVSIQSKQPRDNLFNEGQERNHVIGLAIAFPETNMTDDEKEQLQDFWALGGIANEPEGEPEGEG